MTTALLLALFLTTATDEPETSRLIARLGLPSAAERDAAADALEAKGRAAMPALRAASRASRDAEVRSRAAKLLAKIEHDILTRPTMVALDVRDQAVGEALKALGEKNHFELTGNLDESRSNLQRKVTVRGEKPVPLLAALYRLSAAAGMRPAWGEFDEDDRPLAPKAPMLGARRLPLRRARIAGPTLDSGAFRIKLNRIDYVLQRTRLLEREDGPEESTVGQTCRLGMEIIAEPRLLFKLADDPRILDAIDDQGQSLIDERANASRQFYFAFYEVSESAFSYSIDLVPPKRPGGTLKRFRGVFPILVAELDSESIVVPIVAGSQGKSFDGPDATLTVQLVKLNPVKELTIEVSLQSRFEDLDIPESNPAIPPAELLPFGARPLNPQPEVVNWRHFLPRQFVVLDSKGQEIPGLTPAFERKGPREALVTFGYKRDDDEWQDPVIPARILYYRLIRTTAEIPFEFHDIPLP